MASGTSATKAPPFWASYLLWAPLIVAAGIYLLGFLPFFQRLENLVLDQRIRYRAQDQPPPDPRLCFVAIDDKTLSDFDIAWPFPRKIHAQFTHFIQPGKPGLLVWDFLFDARTDEANDQLFVQVSKEAPMPVVTGVSSAKDQKGYQIPPDFSTNWPEPRTLAGAHIPRGKNLILPFAELRQVTRPALVDAIRDSDGVIRRMPMLLEANGQILPGMALASLMAYWNLSPQQVKIIPGEAIYLDSPVGRRRIPIDAEGYYQLNYRYEVPDFFSVPYSQLVMSYAKRYEEGDTAVTPPDIAGKILLVGQSATGMTDMGPSPRAGESPAPLTHLNIMDNILKEDYLKSVPTWLVWVGFLLFGYATLAALNRLPFWASAIIPVFLVAAFVMLAFLLFARGNWVLPVVGPALGLTALHVGAIGEQVLRERRARRQLRQSFSAYVAPSILESIYKNPDQLKLGGGVRETAILFSDIRGFTSMTEALDSQELVGQLNEYFTEMVGCINRHQGSLHKYIGDAIMAVWGDITNDGPGIDAGQALRAAIEMRATLPALNQRWENQDRPTFQIGIGIAHGRVVAGNVGAPQRMEFTVMGDAVNTASRIEGLTKKFALSLIVGESIYDLTHERFAFRPLSKVRLAGKVLATRIYEPLHELGRESDSPYDPEWLKLYLEAYSRFEEQRWDVAARVFEACLHTYPQDMATNMLLELCRELVNNPPPRDWDGVFEFDSK